MRERPDRDSCLQVRCSGEKHGCDRCRRNGFTCEYQVSMVGRAPKKRRTKADDEILPLPQESRVTPSANLYQSAQKSRSFSQPEASMSMLEGHLPALNNSMGGFAMGDYSAISTEAEINSYLQNLLSEYPDLPLISSGATDPFWLSTGNVVLDQPSDMHKTSKSDGASATTGPRQQSVPSSHTSATSVMSNKNTPSSVGPLQTAESVRSRLAEHTDTRVPSIYRDQSMVSQYPHAAALMRIIEYLEEQLQIARVPIDQAMRLNRQAMTKVREVSNTDEFRRCQSCPLLAATVMDLVVGLYELVILSIQQPRGEGDAIPSPDQNNLPLGQSPLQQGIGTVEMTSDGSSPASAISGASEPPLFQFGCLEFDPDEQVMFRAAMVRRDLRRCVETIQFCIQEIIERQKLTTNSRDSPISRGISQARGPSSNVHTQWYQEMAYRAKELLSALPAQCGHH